LYVAARSSLIAAEMCIRDRLNGLAALKVADSRLKGGADDTRAALEFLLVELAGSGAAKAAV